jgi:hypothetical protein
MDADELRRENQELRDKLAELDGEHEPTKVITVRLPLSLHAELMRTRGSTSMNRIVVELIRKHLANNLEGNPSNDTAAT